MARGRDDVTPPDATPPEPVPSVQELLWQALQRPEAQRAGWLAEQPVSDGVRDEVCDLLIHHDAAGALLDHPVVERPTDSGDVLDEGAPATIPERIGRYRVRRRIASGGMGTVYEAEQRSPQRAVAVKVLDRGLRSPTARQRFAFEAEALARLRHPGIAQVYEAVAPPEGSAEAPYFVMEYVPDARSLTAFADEHGLDVADRVELFTQVCDAVEHGHRRGVIHRDLKPDNILVTGEGRPKIIDFGVARLTDPDGGRTGCNTRAGQLVGTIGSMAPEQVEGDPDRIDIRADVYGLGVVLYSLLAGRPPFDVTDLPVTEAVRVVLESSPEPLGVRDRRLRGDLELIAATAMAKEVERRYASAGALGDDLRRWRGGHPIAARPLRSTYRLSRFVLRNRLAVAAAAVVVLALVTATLISVGAARDAEARRLEAEQARTEEAAQRALAVQALADVQQERTRLETVLKFLVEDVFARPLEQVGSRATELTVSEALDLAARHVGDIEEPWVEAEVRSVLGRIYVDLGHGDRALPHLRRALELRDGRPDTLPPEEQRRIFTVQALADAEYLRGDYDLASAHYDEVETYALRTRQTDTPAYAELCRARASILRDRGDLDGALSLYARAGSIIEDSYGVGSIEWAQLRAARANVLRLQGRLAEAAELLPPAIEALLGRTPRPEEIIAGLATELGVLYSRMGIDEEAESMITQALDIRRRELPGDHPSLAHTITALAGHRFRGGRFFEAAELFEEAGSIYRSRLGPGQAFLLTALANLGLARLAAGDAEQAEAALREVLERHAQGAAHDPVEEINVRAFLAQALGEQGRDAEGLALIDEARALLAGYDLPGGEPLDGELDALAEMLKAGNAP